MTKPKQNEPPGGLSKQTATTPVLTELFSDIETALVAAGVPKEQIVLERPPAIDYGELTLSCFSLAKQSGVTPQKVAGDLAAKLAPTTFVEKWKAVGPYLNLFLRRDVVAALVVKTVLAEKNEYGTTASGDDGTVLVEYVSPNTNKPLHLGHVRNGLLGWSVAELKKTRGAAVVKTDVINDRGIHIMKSLLAYQKWGNGTTPASTGTKGDHFVGGWYVRFEQELAKEREVWLNKNNIDRRALSEPQRKDIDEQFSRQSELLGAAREHLKQWEVGDRDVRTAWEQMNGWVYAAWKETYAALGIDFDKNYYESKIYEGGRERILEGVKRGVFRTEANGAVIAPLAERFKLPDKVLLRGDGTGLYITQDINLAYKKVEDFSPDQSVYCVGSEQELYFRQLFAVLQLLDYPHADRLFHLSYGLVFLPEGKMKSREGTVVDADDLLKKISEYAGQELAVRYPNLSDDERAARQTAIALAALKFSFLDVGRETPIHFDPKAAVSFDGRTGPYLQYAYARASSILRKTRATRTPASVSVGSDAEWRIVLELLWYPAVLHDAADRMDPSRLTAAMSNLARSFSAFYHDQRVLDEKVAALRRSRLALVRAVRFVLARGLGILGIQALEEM